MHEDILVSVIVPVYKVPAFIGKCVESLLDQTHKNLQIILVDDGSPDECGVLCDGYAQRDSRVQVIHKENGGLSDARNAGIEQAAGDYLAFVDGDDFVSEDYIETLLNACITNQTKMAACGYYIYYSDQQMIRHCAQKDRVFSGEEAVRDIFTMKNEIDVVAWNKLYARSLFSDGTIRYPVGKLHEDVFTTWKLCAAAGAISCVVRPCYYYVQRNDSIMGRQFREKRLDVLEALEAMVPFVEAHKPDFDMEYIRYKFLTLLTMLNAMADSGHKNKNLFKSLSNRVMAMKLCFKNNPYFGKKDQFTIASLGMGMLPFYFVRRLYRGVTGGKK